MTEEIGITEVMALIAVITTIDVIIMTGETITIVGTIAEALTEGTTMIDGTIVEATIAEITMTAEVTITEITMTVEVMIAVIHEMIGVMTDVTIDGTWIEVAWIVDLIVKTEEMIAVTWIEVV